VDLSTTTHTVVVTNTWQAGCSTHDAGGGSPGPRDGTSYIVFALKTGTFSRLFSPVSKINKIYHICSSIVIIDSANGDPINGTIRKGMVEY